MDDLVSFLLRAVKVVGKAILVLLDITNTREGLRLLWRDLKRSKDSGDR
jgi:hypothetical protein